MKPDQIALIEKAKSSLAAARLLADDGYFDFSVARAYYTMFYLAEAILLEENKSFSKHSAVIAAFGQLFANAGRVPIELHRYLIDGFDSRNVGDYQTGQSLGPDDANEQIHRAEKFLRVAEQRLSISDGG
jgi:uncharacterized protein (UPF0332 family)